VTSVPGSEAPVSGADPSQAGKGAQTRRTILEAAIARFGRDGFRATSVAEIARDAKVSGTAAYAYFESKEALFLAAVDEDAAAVIREGVSGALGDPSVPDWRQLLIVALLGSLERHPLARRLLAGREPEVTDRVLETPALADLRRAVAERLASEQAHGSVRADIDPVRVANGIVAIMLSLLMSVVQFGSAAADRYAVDVGVVLDAALAPTLPGSAAGPPATGRSAEPPPER